MPVAHSLAIFRLIQQALDNIAAQAPQARMVRVDVSPVVGGLEVLVSDDGCGFDVDRVSQASMPGDGVGLKGMRKRVEIIGESLDIKPTPGQGRARQSRRCCLCLREIRSKERFRPLMRKVHSHLRLDYLQHGPHLGSIIRTKLSHAIVAMLLHGFDVQSHLFCDFSIFQAIGSIF